MRERERFGVITSRSAFRESPAGFIYLLRDIFLTDEADTEEEGLLMTDVVLGNASDVFGLLEAPDFGLRLTFTLTLMAAATSGRLFVLAVGI